MGSMATGQVFQRPKDEWNGILNVPYDFSIHGAKGEPVVTKSSF